MTTKEKAEKWKWYLLAHQYKDALLRAQSSFTLIIETVHPQTVPIAVEALVDIQRVMKE